MSDEQLGPEHDPLPPPVKMPVWVSVAIGVVLVAMAGLAAWTGLRSRDVPFWQSAPGATAARTSASVPGEPEPGASRVMHDGQVRAGATDPDQRAAAVIRGDARSIERTVRLQARRGLTIDVQPASAVVYVNDKLIGEAGQFRVSEQAWEFGEPAGTYRVAIVAPGFRTLQFEVVASQSAPAELAAITGTLDVE